MFEIMLLSIGFLAGWGFEWLVLRSERRSHKLSMDIKRHLLRQYRTQAMMRMMTDDVAIREVERLKRENWELKRRLENV